MLLISPLARKTAIIFKPPDEKQVHSGGLMNHFGVLISQYSEEQQFVFKSPAHKQVCSDSLQKVLAC